MGESQGNVLRDAHARGLLENGPVKSKGLKTGRRRKPPLPR